MRVVLYDVAVIRRSVAAEHGHTSGLTAAIVAIIVLVVGVSVGLFLRSRIMRNRRK
jgi:hypothetical protein